MNKMMLKVRATTMAKEITPNPSQKSFFKQLSLQWVNVGTMSIKILIVSTDTVEKVFADPAEVFVETESDW